MQEPKIAPSLLAADFARLGEQVLEVAKAGADRLHMDIMDGMFVPNISFGPLVLQSVSKVTNLPLETHLMIHEPDRYLEDFAKAGASTLIVHAEGAIHLHRTLERIRSLNIKVGVAINPATPVAVLEPIIDMTDLVLIMTVNPGFGGQKFLERTISKIADVRKRIDQLGLNTELEVDGGIDPKTAPYAVAAGANVLVAGSAVFGSPHGIFRAVEMLKRPVGGSQ
jgi:ribulose-phosphate 3-epimerase